MNLKKIFFSIMLILILCAPVLGECGKDNERINSSEEVCCEGLDMRMVSVVTTKMNPNCKSLTDSCDAVCKNMTRLTESYQKEENISLIVGLVVLAIFIWGIVVMLVLWIKIYKMYSKSNPDFGFLRKYYVSGFQASGAVFGFSYKGNKELRPWVIQMRIILVLIIGFILLGV